MASRKNTKSIPLDLDKLKDTCYLPFDAFAKLGEVRRDKRSGRRHIFIDRGASILAVAHLDSVRDHQHFFTGQIKDSLYIFNAQLDDRLGVYLLLDTLTELLGSHAFDILLTENEERMDSSAHDFVSEKQYRWMFMFDRAGDDVVMYDYDNYVSERKLRAHGLRLARGSYSCIVELEHLGVCGYNFGCGYHDNHSELSHCIWPETATMVGRFLKFFWAEKDNLHPYTPRPASSIVVYDKDHPDGTTGQVLTPPASGKLLLPDYKDEWDEYDPETDRWVRQWREESVAATHRAEERYRHRHAEDQRPYTCIICGSPKYAEEVQLATMTCYLCIHQYQLTNRPST